MTDGSPKAIKDWANLLIENKNMKLGRERERERERGAKNKTGGEREKGSGFYCTWYPCLWFHSLVSLWWTRGATKNKEKIMWGSDKEKKNKK